MGLVAEHVATLEQIAIRQEGPAAARAVEVLRVVSDEEAGKFLILLDVARCANAEPALKADQLRKASNHIAKGIYQRAVDIRPADFAELLRFTKGLRASHYLDGPNDVDWIFRNEIEAEHEEKLYVDYVSTDDGDSWYSPRRYDDLGPDYASGAAELVVAMSRAGFCTTEVLTTIAEVWRDFRPEPETQWSDCRELNRATLERILVDPELSDEDVSRILNTWTFPMYDVDLRRIDVKLDDLRERQRNWSPDGWGRGDYY